MYPFNGHQLRTPGLLGQWVRLSYYRLSTKKSSTGEGREGEDHQGSQIVRT